MTWWRCSLRVAVCSSADNRPALLSRPANEFVSKFIGLGRGYRWLQLIDSAGLPVHDIDRISVSSLGSARLPTGWALVVTDENVPLGWIDGDGLRRHRDGATLSECLAVVGSVFRPPANLSQALDAALSSPSSVGVAVDGCGRVVGGVLAADVLAAFHKGKQPGG